MSNDNKKLKPFDLKRALAGGTVVTKNGLEVTQLVLFNCNNYLKLSCVIDGELMQYPVNGEYFFISSGDSTCRGRDDLDLFMAPVKKQGLLNVFNNATYGQIYDTKKEAMSIRGLGGFDDMGYVDTVMIEWEE